MKSSTLTIGLLLCLPFLVVIATHFPTPMWPDAIMYDSIMRDFLKTHLFRCSIFSDFDPAYLQANFDNGPIYSLLHLLMFKLFGTTDSRILVVTNYLLVLLSCYNIGRILQLRGHEWYLLCLITFNPLVIHSANLIRPEWLNVYILSWIWRVLCNYNRSHYISTCILTGLLLALAAQTHYFSIFFIPFVIYECWISENTLKRRARLGLYILLSTFIFMTPYTWYILSNINSFKIQVLNNRLHTNTSHSILNFLQHFLQPLFFPSSTIYTESNIVPRWLPVVFHLSLITAITGLIIKWRQKIQLTHRTQQAIAVWISICIGTSFVSYTPYMIFYFSVVTVALWKDLVPHLNWNFRIILASIVISSLTYSIFFDSYVAKYLFNWPAYQSSVQCLSNNIPLGAKLYVLAYPDPSVELSIKRNDLDIRRYSDFARYTKPWEGIARSINYVVTSKDSHFLQRFDHGNALRHQFDQGTFQNISCDVGPIHYHLWVRTPAKKETFSVLTSKTSKTRLQYLQ